jgi:hypothetical protein
MKKFILGLITLSSFSVFASQDACKSKALNVAKAVDKVYVAQLVKGTKISITRVGTTESSYQWLVNFLVPNAGGQTAYSIEMQKDSCEIINLSQFSE